MAARESQSLQIALIITFILTVGLVVFTVALWKMNATKFASLEAATREKNDFKQRYEITDYKYKAYLYMLGDTSREKPNRAELTDHAKLLETSYQADLSSINAQLDQFDKDMATYAHDLPEADHGYRNIPDHLEKTIRSKNSAYLVQLRQADLDRESATVAKTKLTTTEETYKNNLKAESDKVNKELDKYEKERQRVKSEKEERKQNYDKLVTTSDQQKSKDNKTIGTLTKKIDMMADTLSVRRSKDERRSKFFEVADGRVTLVNDRRGTVWINLGSADGLRELTTFGVYDSRTDGVMRNEEEIKARIQVTKVLDQHLSEARITDDELKNPVLPGDQIHSPAWQAGKEIHFALVGFFDLDGDGKSDRETVRNMIASTGGIVDAEVREDGTKNGRITSRTRYVIKADYEQLGTSRGYHELMEEIQAHDVEQISLDAFLTYIGWKQETFWVSLGRGAESKNFVRGLTEREKPSTVSNESFRQRTPLKTPDRGKKGAF